MISTESRSSAQRKRQRLDQLVDRIAHFVSSSQNHPNGVRSDTLTMETGTDSTGLSPQPTLMSRLRVRSASRHGQVFSFDHVMPCGDQSEEEAEEEVFSPLATFSDRLTLSPCSTVDSPSGISFSPLSFDDDIPKRASLTPDPSAPLNLSKTSRHHTSIPLPLTSSPLYPRMIPQCPPVMAPLAHMSSACRRRAHSDSDLRETLSLYPQPATTWIVTPAVTLTPSVSLHPPRLSRLEHLRPPPLVVSVKRNSSDSDSSSPLLQESPVDLSVRSGSSVSSESPNQTNTTVEYFDTPRFCAFKSRSSRTKTLTRSLSLSQYLSPEYSPDLTSDDVSHTLMGPPNKPSFTCDVCGQVFDLHDRLVKHLASRHKSNRTVAEGSVVKGYQCDVCQRPFARSDMLTRHMRLHTGLKPYTCRTCGQVFSRSDHLSTHQRTHTGEKPYRCPQCAYAACRRDMITRHLRTHTRSEDLELPDVRKDSA
nr:EOG090X0G73 [Cyclestheria hislopi]